MSNERLHDGQDPRLLRLARALGRYQAVLDAEAGREEARSDTDELPAPDRTVRTGAVRRAAEERRPDDGKASAPQRRRIRWPSQGHRPPAPPSPVDTATWRLLAADVVGMVRPS